MRFTCCFLPGLAQRRRKRIAVKVLRDFSHFNALGQWLGLDIFAPGYGTPALLGIALVGLGGGLGLHAAKRWQASRRSKPAKD